LKTFSGGRDRWEQRTRVHSKGVEGQNFLYQIWYIEEGKRGGKRQEENSDKAESIGMPVPASLQKETWSGSDTLRRKKQMVGDSQPRPAGKEKKLRTGLGHSGATEWSSGGRTAGAERADKANVPGGRFHPESDKKKTTGKEGKISKK